MRAAPSAVWLRHMGTCRKEEQKCLGLGSLRSCTGSTRGHSSWTVNSRVCSSWTGSRMTHSLRSSRAYSSWTGSSRACSSWTGSRMTHSLRRSSRAYSSWTGSSHRSHSPPWSLHRNHSPLWNPHKSHNPPWSPHRSHSWSRNRLAHSSIWACSSRWAHSSWSHSPHSQSHSPHSRSHSPHSRSHSPHSRSHSPHNQSHSPHSRSHSPHNQSHSPHSRSHSLQSNHNSPWFWWIESGAGRGAGEREVQVWSPLSLGHLYTCLRTRAFPILDVAAQNLLDIGE
ncbi:thyroid hormone receptor-associated protein 3-like [Rhinopithecus roxellana]|uniref:thyroid hormone receptor-associated protein 3-like n=1 Tax=Rhinopithecus roxellana TaxID=61622 RepID=UPI0012378CC4|nr:thyroid hormone receptor-associated protein 3-like [Rhinopithecus roxellana]